MSDINEDKEKEQKREVIAVRVSAETHSKASQLERFQKFSTANRVWGKDQKLIRYNLLQVPTSRNYTVLLAMGKNRGRKVS